jgi:hypothetical protein
MILHVRGGDMVIEMFLALPLFTENKQPRFISICMEFIPGAPGLCTDEGNNPGYLIDKVPAMPRVNMAPGRYEQHTFYSDAGRKKYPVFPAVQKHPAADLPGEFFSNTRPAGHLPPACQACTQDIPALSGGLVQDRGRLYCR